MTPWFDGGCGSCERTSCVANELNLTALDPHALLNLLASYIYYTYIYNAGSVILFYLLLLMPHMFPIRCIFLLYRQFHFFKHNAKVTLI